MSEPIRVGIIGLSANGSWAAAAHLPYLRTSTRYILTAVVNSSLESSKAAIAAHGLPVDRTKAYCSPEDLANDPDVDLIVCSINAAHHYDALRQAVNLGKDVYCEWPLGRDLAEAEELNKVAKANGSRTMIGLQSRCSPVVAKLKELISQDIIGRILSSTLMGPALHSGFEDSKRMEHAVKGDLRDNFVTEFCSHSIETILSTLGELKSYSSMLDIREPEKPETTANQASKSNPGNQSDSGPEENEPKENKPEIISDSNVTVKAVTQAQIMLQAYFESGGVLSFHLHGGRKLPPGDGLQWRIWGEKGELTITAPDSVLHITAPEKVKIRLFESATGKTEEIHLPTDQWDELPTPAQNVARLYEAFADDRTEQYPDWEHAVKRHKIIDSIGTTSGHTVVLQLDLGGRASDFKLLAPIES